MCAQRKWQRDGVKHWPPVATEVKHTFSHTQFGNDTFLGIYVDFLPPSVDLRVLIIFLSIKKQAKAATTAEKTMKLLPKDFPFAVVVVSDVNFALPMPPFMSPLVIDSDLVTATFFVAKSAADGPPSFLVSSSIMVQVVV